MSRGRDNRNVVSGESGLEAHDHDAVHTTTNPQWKAHSSSQDRGQQELQRRVRRPVPSRTQGHWADSGHTTSEGPSEGLDQRGSSLELWRPVGTLTDRTTRLNENQTLRTPVYQLYFGGIGRRAVQSTLPTPSRTSCLSESFPVKLTKATPPREYPQKDRVWPTLGPYQFSSTLREQKEHKISVHLKSPSGFFTGHQNRPKLRTGGLNNGQGKWGPLGIANRPQSSTPVLNNEGKENTFSRKPT